MKQDEQLYTAKQMDYAAYVKKFLPNYVYTTDDTFTPPKVYQAVIDWLTMEGKTQGRRILRPFYPGGDFEAIDYKPGDFVVDNPPFSQMSRIVRFYQEHKIDFFLFYDRRYSLSYLRDGLTLIYINESIEFENGALIVPAFVTNVFDGAAVYSSKTLNEMIKAGQVKQTEPRNEYPDDVFSFTIFEKIAKLKDYIIPHGKISRVKKLIDKNGRVWSSFGSLRVKDPILSKEMKEMKEMQDIKDTNRLYYIDGME